MTLRNLFYLLAFAQVAVAGDLVVVVSGATAGKREVGCALYRSAAGFPVDPAKAAATTWVKAAPHVECRFKDVAPGLFAVAVSVDWNGNRRIDKNMLGMPTEPWGVSNDARPSLRAPRYDEATATMPPGDLQIEVKVTK